MAPGCILRPRRIALSDATHPPGFTEGRRGGERWGSPPATNWGRASQDGWRLVGKGWFVRPGGCLCLAGPAPCCRTKAGGFGEPSASKAIGLPKTARSSQISTPTSSAGGCHVWDGVGWKCQCQRCQTAQGETQTGQREPGSLLQAQPGPLGSGGIFPYSRGRTTRNKGIWGIPPKTSR